MCPTSSGRKPSCIESSRGETRGVPLSIGALPSSRHQSYQPVNVQSWIFRDRVNSRKIMPSRTCIKRVRWPRVQAPRRGIQLRPVYQNMKRLLGKPQCSRLKGFFLTGSATAPSPQQVEATEFYGSSHSNIYHLPSRRWAQKITPEHLITFFTNQGWRLEKAGDRPCKVCKP